MPGPDIQSHPGRILATTTHLELSRGFGISGVAAATALGELLLSGNVPNIQTLDLTVMNRNESFHLLKIIRDGELPSIRHLHILNGDARDDSGADL